MMKDTLDRKEDEKTQPVISDARGAEENEQLNAYQDVLISTANTTKNQSISHEQALYQDTELKSRIIFLLVAFIVVFITSFGAIWFFQFVVGDRPYSGEWKPALLRKKIDEQIYRQYVTDAERKSIEAFKLRAKEFSDFIESSKSGANAFSEEMLSLKGKWKAFKAMLPFTDSNEHKAFVAQKLGEHIFTNEQLAAAVRRAVEDSVKDLESIENQLAVTLKQELLGRTLSPDETPIAAAEFERAVNRLMEGSQWDTKKAMGNLMVAELTSQIGMQIVARLGTSLGILSVGAANSYWSIGIAVVIGFMVDYIWNWVDDPAGDIEREMLSALEKLSVNASATIEEEMTKVISQRSVLWNKRVTEILP